MKEDYVSTYDSYMDDISELDMPSDSEKIELLNELVDMIRKMEDLFVLAGCDKLVLPRKRKPWIVDKVRYSLDNCKNIDVLTQIKEIYNDYLVKRERFMDGYLRFVVFIAKQYYKGDGWLPLDDLIQFGNMGLIRALELYNPELGTKFSSYAGIKIRQCILDGRKNVMHIIRKPFHAYALNNRRIDAINILAQELGREPSDREVAEYMGISIDEVKLLANDFSDMVSLDEMHEYSFSDMFDDMYVTMSDKMIDESVDLDSDVFNSCLARDFNDCMLEYLDERERLILWAREIDELEFSKIALQVELSKQRVWKIHKNVGKKLRSKSRVRELLSYIR